MSSIARFVYIKHASVDYNKTKATVIKPTLFRSLFFIEVYSNWHIKQMDIVMAFVYGLLDQVVYIE